jgi:hypothetical protein
MFAKHEAEYIQETVTRMLFIGDRSYVIRDRAMWCTSDGFMQDFTFSPDDFDSNLEDETVWIWYYTDVKPLYKNSASTALTNA